MKIYYFKRDINRPHNFFGTGKEDYYTTELDLIIAAESFFGKKLTQKEINLIVSDEVPDFDYYAVQGWCDGFGNDTYTKTCFKTLKEAQNYVRKSAEGYKIVGQWFGKDYRRNWE